jgi:nucleoside-triphosphatase THEP1
MTRDEPDLRRVKPWLTQPLLREPTKHNHAMKKRNAPAILITGSPGSGKSTLLARLIKDVGARQIAGLSAPEFRQRNQRVGFKMIDLGSGEEEVLASTSGTGPTVGKYHVNVDAIDRIVAKIELALPSARFIL